MVWVDAVMVVLSFIPTVLVWWVFDIDFDDGSFGIWPALVTTTLGVTGAVGDLVRWMKTWYRVTDERIELRSGWLTRKYRSVPRDRIRSVDTTAKPRHRVAGLRVVHISSGEAQLSFKLDAVTKQTAEELRRELLIGGTAGIAASEEDAASEETPAPGRDETPIAELNWRWIWYNLINIWAFIVAALLLWGLFWLLQIFNIDLRDLIAKVIDWEALGQTWSIVVAIGGTFLIGVAGLAFGFVNENWNFQLVRTTTEKGTALLTRQGLFDTREVFRDDRRLRGIHLSQPLFWRWIGLTETEVVSTGLGHRASNGEPASSILPRAPIGEVLRVAALVLPDGVRPLEAPLLAHPQSALYRRFVSTVVGLAGWAGLLYWMDVTGAVPSWTWLSLLALIPFGLVFSVIGYRALGHAIVGPYLVLRSGVSRLSTLALQRPAVIGWSMQESLLQRALGLVNVGVATAAGARHYKALDLSPAQAVALIHQTAPGLIDDFLEPLEDLSSANVASEEIGPDVLREDGSVGNDPTAFLSPSSTRRDIAREGAPDES
ncbi:PH domain-containing protein [Actinoplanes sp. NEAU-A12]|uniref:PH domain-containing protein n=1 Tax=Actinoplanes sandaracinus TaxID=3045177 RepID=A0ABT6WZX8_9ACTN|nr:PH domain-containing protein [Actinoplanes sandaracinus]MDI6105156.1 PH domain-containing protein [Actinoplanes sandaracinus]